MGSNVSSFFKLPDVRWFALFCILKFAYKKNIQNNAKNQTKNRGCVLGFRKNLGHKIAVERKRAGLRQYQLAAAIGMERTSTLSNYERGRTEVPLSVLSRIAKVLNIPIAALIPSDTYSTVPAEHNFVTEGDGPAYSPHKPDPDAAACLDALARSGALNNPQVREIIQLLIQVAGHSDT